MTVYPDYRGLGLRIPSQVKRRVFVSYHHKGDQAYYDAFSRTFAERYDVIQDNSIERKIDSDDAEYMMRHIRENYVTGSSCTIVLVGRDTWGRKFVDWEIDATLSKCHGLLGLQLPTLPIVNNSVTVPDRLSDNIGSGYALWKRWDYLVTNPGVLAGWIEECTGKDMRLIQNGRARRIRNA